MSTLNPAKPLALVKLIVAIACGGLISALMLVPAVGGAGLAAKSAAGLFNYSSSRFTQQNPSTVSTVLAADGSTLTNYYSQYRVPIALAQMGQWLPKAIVAIEDKRFYQHGAVDITGTLRAGAKDLVTGGVSQGGSTLTQQLVKNTLLYQATTQSQQQAATTDTLGRKVNEAKIAIELAKKYSKDQILQMYLNLMNMGQGAYGVDAAANTYFGVAPANLTLDQAALLAGLVQSPTNYDPVTNPANAKTRRDTVLAAMQSNGDITKAQADTAIGKPITLNPGAQPSRTCAAAPSDGGFFCDYLTNYLTKTLGIPQTALDQNGLTIKSTFQPSAQVAVTNGILGASAALGRDPGIYGLGDSRLAMMDVLNAKNGQILALGVNKRFGNSPTDPTQTAVNYPTVPGEGGGSTYKLFTAVTGLEQGVGINYVTGANAPYTSKKFSNNGKPYVVNNASPYYGANLPLWKALYQSENTYFVGLEDHIGNMDPIVNTAQAMGLWAPGDTAIANQVKAQQQASFTLGPGSTNPLRLAVAYATTANRGTRCEPVPVTAVLGPDGKSLINPSTKKPYFTPGTNCTANVIPQGVADTINNILLKDVMPGNPGQTAARANTDTGRQIAGKSGTAEYNASYAFVGYTPQIVTSVLAYDPTNNNPLPAPSAGAQGYGGGYPATMWRLAMQNILKNYPQVSFPPPDPQVVAGTSSNNSTGCANTTSGTCSSGSSNSGPSNSGPSNSGPSNSGPSNSGPSNSGSPSSGSAPSSTSNGH